MSDLTLALIGAVCFVVSFIAILWMIANGK